jgi:hypothetical protein
MLFKPPYHKVLPFFFLPNLLKFPSKKPPMWFSIPSQFGSNQTRGNGPLWWSQESYRVPLKSGFEMHKI